MQNIVLSKLEIWQFGQNQVRQLKDGGLPVLKKKIIKCFESGISLFFIPVVITVRCLRPLCHIRIGKLRSDRIGHFSGNTEIYVKLKEMRGGHKTCDVFYHTYPISNAQMKKMWDRKLAIIPFGKFLDTANRMIPGWRHFTVRMPIDVDRHGIFQASRPSLSFTLQEEKIGSKIIRDMGFDNTTPWICFHARDNAYLNQHLTDTDWNYHNYRDSDILKMIPAVRQVVSRGYTAFRMGALVNKEIPADDKRIMDYANSRFRNDFMDIYLSAKCRFLIGSTGGICAVPRIFRRPTAYVNFTAFSYGAWTVRDLVIPKKFWLKDEKRLLTFKEVLASDIARAMRTEDFVRAGVELVENTTEEITDLVQEMEDRLSGNVKLYDSTKDLQERFQRLYTESNSLWVPAPRLGSKYLEQNKDLLD